MSSDMSNFQPEVPMAEGTRPILMDSSTDVSAADESRKRVLDSENASEVEVDGELMSSLRKAVSMTTKKCLSAARYQQFQSYFEQIKKKYPKALKSIQTQFLQQLEAAISDEISKMYSEENIVGLMNQLEELSEKSDPDKTAWRPCGVVTDDVRAHLLPLKQKHAERLRKLADKLEQENSQLRAAVEARRKRFLATRRAILDSVSQIEMAHVACEEYPVEPLVDFVQSDGHKIHWLG